MTSATNPVPASTNLIRARLMQQRLRSEGMPVLPLAVCYKFMREAASKIDQIADEKRQSDRIARRERADVAAYIDGMRSCGFWDGE